MTISTAGERLCTQRVEVERSKKMVEPQKMIWYTYFRYLFLRAILWLTRSGRRSRFADTYDLSSKDPYKYGGLPAQCLYEAEWPSPPELLDRTNDGIQFFCTSPSGQIMTLSMTRRSKRHATVFLYLRSHRGSYVLPKDVQVDQSTGDTFAVDGLHIECVLPMRRWRISFNGLLRNQMTGEEDHVRFVFTCNYMSGLTEQDIFYDEPLLAAQLAQSPMLSLRTVLRDPSVINRSLKEIDSLVQTYSFVGKIRVEERHSRESYEEEMFTFGHKKRFHERLSSAVESLGLLMGYTKNGIFIHLEEVAIRNLSATITTGAILFPSLMQGRIDNATFNVMCGNDISRSFVLGSGNLNALEMLLTEEVDAFTMIHQFNNEMLKKKGRVFKISFDQNEGYAVFFGSVDSSERVEIDLPSVASHLMELRSLRSEKCPNVVSFEEDLCVDSNLTGGKASSLAVLMRLSKESGEFEVAKGLAVTTAAYEIFRKQLIVAEEIERLENAIRDKAENLQEICKGVVKIVGGAAIPLEVRQDLEEELKKMFGSEFTTRRFAVRSSAIGEDSEEMSAAGQMKTFLGCRGLEEIASALAQCWASQFSFVAIQYRRRYGQEINCRMSVCIQELVASEVAGVMFTVDPVTGNPRLISITANYGLGETVVSAMADPDTFVLEKTSPSGTELIEQIIGKKQVRSFVGDSEISHIELSPDQLKDASAKPCLSEEQLKQLGDAARLIENYYGGPQDTEWAFTSGGDILFLLQARPITSIHQLDSEFEFYHEADEAVASELDCLSKANVGEVFGGSVSPITLELMFRCFIGKLKEEFRQNLGIKKEDFMFLRDQFLVIQNSQCFLTTCSMTMDFSKEDIVSKGFAISMSGRILDDEIIKIGAENKRKYLFTSVSPSPIKLIRDLWTAEEILEYSDHFVQNAEVKLDECATSREMLLRIMENPQIGEMALLSHQKQIINGSLFNVLVLALLARAEGDWTSAVFSDFAKIVTSCNNLVSADVPFSLEVIARQAEEDYGGDFQKLSEKEALEKLQNDKTPTAKMFSNFLEKHGHRCLHEFDLSSRPWKMDPLPVVKTIQSMIGKTQATRRQEMNIEELLDAMQIKVGLLKRFVLRFLLHRVRKGIANRERAKSNLILSSHKYRMLFRQLADKLVAENRLPDPELVFFLLPAEIMQLIETRSPKIIVRAMNRKRNQSRAAKDLYPEYSTGLPFKPVNVSSARPVMKGSRRIEGTPVSQGQVTAPCRVVLSLEDVHEIQSGDILITYATDIGWSPYFPMLSGIVTELGGLISHGAVVAREYGLPCVVAAHGATTLFRSGETIHLDGSKGFLQTVDGNQS